MHGEKRAIEPSKLVRNIVTKKSSLETLLLDNTSDLAKAFHNFKY